jgi:alkanesulfonate monooxygenase SsuD/methylene tetrahydromethanopterin reductase-like flavin-dependent oxidoreductase (luciferase family)
VGATGERVALEIVARHANVWNGFGSPEVFERKIAVLGEHCRKAGRDPETIEKSALLQMTLTDDPETARRALKDNSGMLAGNLGEVRRQIERYIAVGVTHIILSLTEPYDYVVLRRFATVVVPAFR